MTYSIQITVPANPDLDDCLAGAAEAYIEEHPELEGVDLSPEWGENRETVTLTVPVETRLARVEEEGNGFAGVGDLVSIEDQLYRVLSTGRIHTCQWAANYMYCEVAPADDADDDEEEIAEVRARFE